MDPLLKFAVRKVCTLCVGIVQGCCKDVAHSHSRLVALGQFHMAGRVARGDATAEAGQCEADFI